VELSRTASRLTQKAPAANRSRNKLSCASQLGLLLLLQGVATLCDVREHVARPPSSSWCPPSPPSSRPYPPRTPPASFPPHPPQELCLHHFQVLPVLHGVKLQGGNGGGGGRGSGGRRGSHHCRQSQSGRRSRGGGAGAEEPGRRSRGGGAGAEEPGRRSRGGGGSCDRPPFTLPGTPPSLKSWQPRSHSWPLSDVTCNKGEEGHA